MTVPATDSDLIFYHFMGALVRDHRDSIMKDDFEHWEKHGLYQGFETFIQQQRAKAPYDPEMRKAWLQEMMARRASKRAGKKSVIRESPSESAAPAATSTSGVMGYSRQRAFSCRKTPATRSWSPGVSPGPRPSRLRKTRSARWSRWWTPRSAPRLRAA